MNNAIHGVVPSDDAEAPAKQSPSIIDNNPARFKSTSVDPLHERL